MHNPMLGAVIALVLWSFVMWAWMYATRIPAISKHKIALDPQRTNNEFFAQLPPSVRWKSDNLNNLMEQPTLFYAVALTLVLLNAETTVNLALAWSYVGIRVVHSLIQATVNTITVRFLVFVLGSIVLFALTIHAAMIVF